MKTYFFLITLGSLVVANLAAQTVTRDPSFGPNGTHWPGQVTGLATPYMYDETVPNQFEVDCSWTAISAKIKELTTAQVSQGVLILVKPGVLASSGAQNNSGDALLEVGDINWPKRVTIAPRDGWGSVRTDDGIKFTRVRNICIAGIDIRGGLRFVSSTRFAVARCTVAGYIAVFGRMRDETDYRQWEFVEMVKREVFAPHDSDAMQLQVPFDGAQNHIEQTVFDGCYFAPNYMNIGSTAHQDTIQFLGVGQYFFRNTTLQDTVIFSSNRVALNGGLLDSVIRHCYLSSRPENQTSRYPVPVGAVMESNAGVNQGTMGNITFDGGFIMGNLQSNQGVDETPYDTVINNATIDYQPSGHAAPTSGQWNVDSTLDGINNPGLPPLPTDEYLQSIWGPDVDVENPTSQAPTFSQPSGTYDQPQTVTLSAPSGSTILFTLDSSDTLDDFAQYDGSGIALSSNSTLRAFTRTNGLADSFVASQTYQFAPIPPAISPGSGTFIGEQTVTISASGGYEIFYIKEDLDSNTTDPETLYSGPFTINESSNITARAVHPQLGSSAAVTAELLLDSSLTSTPQWSNFPLPSQDSSFILNWASEASASDIDAVTGVSFGPADEFNDLACIVRFAPAADGEDSFIDARDGNTYRYTNAVPYLPNVTYNFSMAINLESKTYSVFVSYGDQNAIIAANFGFRTSQANVQSLNNLAIVAPNGSHQIDGFTVDPGNPVPSPPADLRQIE